MNFKSWSPPTKLLKNLNNKRYEADHKEAKEFILKFDGTTPYCRVLLPEFSFTIDVPDSVIESIGIEEAHEIISKSSTLELA